MKKRQDKILERVEYLGACTYQELTDFFNVSSMTIRRDVEHLASEQKLIKTLGGIQKINSPQFLYESSLASRISFNQNIKRSISELALSLIKPGKTLYIDGGTTCIELAKLIAIKCHDLTVVSNSPLICLELSQNHTIKVIGIGGECDPVTMCFIGDDTEEVSSKYYVDISFISTKGFVPEEGTFESAIGTSKIKKIITKKSKKIVLLVDHSKFGQYALCKVLDISKIDTVVTDSETPVKYIDALNKSGKKVLTVSLQSSQEQETLAFNA